MLEAIDDASKAWEFIVFGVLLEPRKTVSSSNMGSKIDLRPLTPRLED